MAPRSRPCLWLAPIALALLLTWPAAALPVDVEIVLAVDVSRSIDAFEYDLQQRGYADAFRDKRVLDAIRANPHQRIAVTLVEWAGAEFQAVKVGWTLIDDAASAAAFGQALLTQERAFSGWTSISGAIDFSVPLFEDNGYEGTRKVIDVSGDGINNSGRPAAAARDAALAKGITINGLAILNDRPNPVPSVVQPPRIPVDQFFLDNVIGGSGAFLITAKDFQDFAQAVAAKLIREIAGSPMPQRQAAACCAAQ